MLTTVTLWTLMIWAEPLHSRQALSVANLAGFATEASCLAARDRIITETSSQSGGRGTGQTGIDIKFITCVPVEYEKELR